MYSSLREVNFPSILRARSHGSKVVFQEKRMKQKTRSNFNAAGLFLGQPYLCLTSDMLKGLVSALVFSHPPQKLDSPNPNARSLAVLV